MSAHAEFSPEAPPPLSRSQRLRFLGYLAPVVLFPILLLASAFVILPSRWFIVRSGNTYYANLGYGDHLRNRRCDILIYGDSSAMVGIDPAILQQRTGLTACNIAEFEGMTLINHTLILDNFLTHNPRPRYIVFMYTPEDLYLPKTWDKGVATFEGISYLVQTVPPAQVAGRLAAHPLESLTWAEQGMRMVLTHLHTPPLSSDAQHLRDNHLGQLPVPESTRTECYPPSPYFEAPDAEWIASLRARYGRDGTRVFVDATPTVPCDNGVAFYQRHLDGLVDDSPYLPIDMSNYSTDGRLHANRAGVTTLSNMVAAQIESTRPDKTSGAVQSSPSGGR